MLQIVVEVSMDSALLRCSGRLVAGEEVVRLREAVMCHVDTSTVQLDLAGLKTIDAAGLGLLVSLHTLGCVVGFRLQVRNPARRVRALLKLTRLDSVLEIRSAIGGGTATARHSSGDRYVVGGGPKALGLDPVSVGT